MARRLTLDQQQAGSIPVRSANKENHDDVDCPTQDQESLAAEALIIRRDERKSTGDTRNSLHNHRKCVVRPEARASLLAYAFLRDRPLHTLEHPDSRCPDWDNVRRIVKKFSGVTIFDEAEFSAWAGIERRDVKKAA